MLANVEQLLELLLEQAVVVAEIEAEERERLDERAAPDHHLRASAGEQIERRELLIEPNRDRRAEYGDRAREPDALRTRRGRREHDGRSGDGELGPVVLADAVDVEPDLVRELDLLHELAQALLRAALAGARVGEGEGPDLHDLVLPVACRQRRRRTAPVIARALPAAKSSPTPIMPSPIHSTESSSAPMLMSAETPRDSSALMTTTRHVPSSGSQSRVCSPCPSTDVVQNSSSVGGLGGAVPG